MPEDVGLRERVIEAARLLGSDEVEWCPEERYCGKQEGEIFVGDACADCWARYILTGE